MLKSASSAILCGLFVTLASSVALGDMNLLSNGDFETGDLSGWTWTPDPNAEPSMLATVAPFAGSLAFRVNPGNDSGPGGGEKGGTLSQEVNLVGGVIYTVSGGLLAIQDVNSSPNDPYGNLDGGTITVSLDGNVLHTFDVGQTAVDELVTDSFTAMFLATSSGPASLSLRFTREYMNPVPSILHYADDLSIVAIPAPGAVVLGFIGLGVLGWVKRRLA